MSDRSDRRNSILLLSSSTLVVVPLAGAELGRAEAHAEDGDQGDPLESNEPDFTGSWCLNLCFSAQQAEVRRGTLCKEGVNLLDGLID